MNLLDENIKEKYKGKWKKKVREESWRRSRSE
jgi:hypothetical protein